MAGRLYVGVVQAVILFESETWVLNSGLEKYLEGFCHHAARQMTGMGPKCQKDRKWVYPPIGVALEMVGLDYIRVYISLR